MEKDSENPLGGLDMQMLQQMMGGMAGGGKGMPDPLKMAKMFTKSNSPQLLESTLKGAGYDRMLHGHDMMAVAVSAGADKSVDYFLKQGVPLDSPPDAVPEIDDYRKTPYIFQAIKSGNRQTIEMVLQRRPDLDETGIVCFSRKRKNLVTTNLVGAAAYAGLADVMKKFLKDKLGGLNHKATESTE